jgi:hypothetical protein
MVSITIPDTPVSHFMPNDLVHNRKGSLLGSGTCLFSTDLCRKQRHRRLGFGTVPLQYMYGAHLMFREYYCASFEWRRELPSVEYLRQYGAAVLNDPPSCMNIPEW